MIKNNRSTQSAAAAAGATIATSGSSGNSDIVSITTTNIWLTAFIGSLSRICIYLNMKYNSVIFYQVSKLLIIPCMLAYSIFISPPFKQSSNASDNNKSNEYGKSHIQSLLSFIIVLFGMYIFSLNDTEFKFTPGLFYAIISVVLASFYQILISSITQTCLAMNNNSNNNSNSINNVTSSEVLLSLKRILSLPEFVITFIFGFWFDVSFKTKNKFSFFDKKFMKKSKIDVSHIIFNIVLAAILLFYENIVFLISENSNSTSTSSLSSSIFFVIINMAKPILVICIGLYMNIENITKLGIGAFIVTIGYLFYCFFELEALNKENQLRKMKFQEEEDNLEEPLGKRGEEGIFHMALNTEELQNE